MTEASSTETTGPYAMAAATYWSAGWRGILPLPARRKKSPPDGYTGRNGAWPSYPDVQAWTEDRSDGNIALRLPPDVLGIDVDHYGSKPGGAVLAHLEGQLGALPATWRTTSRDDGSSGIRLYRIPAGLRWPGVLGPGIETIRAEHRYAVAWPSIHPDTGGTYRWITPDGATALGVVPSIDDLPALPTAWIDHFTHGELSSDQPQANLTDDGATGWLIERGEGQPCRRMSYALNDALGALTGATSRHDATLSSTNRMVWLAGEGHPGAIEALRALRKAFVKAMAGDRSDDDLRGEWQRMVQGAVRIAAAAHPQPSSDPCDDPFAGLISKDTTWTSHNSPSSTSAPSAVSTSTAQPTAHSAVAPAIGSTTTSTTGLAPLSPARLAAETATATAPDAADDLTELQIRRNQAMAQEVERLRAQRAAQRLIEVEDEDQAIADRVRRRLLDDKASDAYRIATEPPAPAFDAGTLADVLARPAGPPMRVEGLLPWAGSGLVVAQRKTGKTTLLLNYARCLLTGEPFLGEFDVIALPPDASVAFLNYEVSAAQLARWANETGVPDDRLFMVNLRGRRNPLGRPDDRAELAAILRGKNVQAVIVDPFGRAYTGVSQNDNGEVQSFLVGLEEFVRADVGALDLLLATHAGWDGERTRGASALEDWGDTIITLTRDADDESRRFMKAMGRDVEVDEDELVMDPLTRVLRRTGNGSRKSQRGSADAAQVAVFVVRAVRDNPGCSKTDIGKAVAAMEDYRGKSVLPGRGDSRLKAAIEFAVEAGRITVEKGVNGGKDRHFEVTTTTTTAPPPGGGHQTTTTTVCKKVVVGGASGPAEHKPASGGGSKPKTVHRAVAGRLVDINLDTGEIVGGEA